jgi:hypothetical protein
VDIRRVVSVVTALLYLLSTTGAVWAALTVKGLEGQDAEHGERLGTRVRDLERLILGLGWACGFLAVLWMSATMPEFPCVIAWLHAHPGLLQAVGVTAPIGAGGALHRSRHRLLRFKRRHWQGVTLELLMFVTHQVLSVGWVLVVWSLVVVYPGD